MDCIQIISTILSLFRLGFFFCSFLSDIFKNKLRAFVCTLASCNYHFIAFSKEKKSGGHTSTVTKLSFEFLFKMTFAQIPVLSQSLILLLLSSLAACFLLLFRMVIVSLFYLAIHFMNHTSEWDDRWRKLVSLLSYRSQKKKTQKSLIIDQLLSDICFTHLSNGYRSDSISGGGGGDSDHTTEKEHLKCQIVLFFFISVGVVWGAMLYAAWKNCYFPHSWQQNPWPCSLKIHHIYSTSNMFNESHINSCVCGIVVVVVSVLLNLCTPISKMWKYFSHSRVRFACFFFSRTL